MDKRKVAGLAALLATLCMPLAQAGSIRFFGTGTGDIDRVKIRIDDPAVDAGEDRPADVGAGDFTIEFWIRGTKADNASGTLTRCGAVYGWIDGHIVLDRDRLNRNGAFGISVGNQGRVAFGANGNATFTLCGFTDVLDDNWHHVEAVRLADGRLFLFVDGLQQDTTAFGPTGDISYPDDADPPSTGCGPSGQESCDFSDPFLVIGAEKHDLNPNSSPSFSGFIDELRISSVARHIAPFTPPMEPFAGDEPGTAALYHFDETTGTNVSDVIGKSPGEMRVAGVPPADVPKWASETPFAQSGSGQLRFSQQSYFVSESDGSATAAIMRVGGDDGPASVTCATSNGSAQEPGDFQQTTVTLSWVDNEQTEKPCTVPIVNDAIGEGAEEFQLALSNQSGASLGFPSTATVTITEDSASGTLRLQQPTFVVSEGVGSFNVGVTRANGTIGSVSVRVSTQDGSATAGSDYVAASTLLTWGDGEGGTKNASIAVTGDAAAESSETLTVALSDVTGGASIGAPSSATVTINDDDSGGGGGGGGGGAIGWWWLLASLPGIGMRAQGRRLHQD